MLKKSIFLAIALLMVCSIITPPVHAQSSIHDLTRQQQEEIVKIQENLLTDKISYAEYLKLMTEIINRPEVTYDPAKLIPPGGNIVNPTGTAWEDNWRHTSHDVYDGIKYSFGGSGASVWDFELDIWNTYTANPSTGHVIEYYHDNRSGKSDGFFYSVTDFRGSNKTLRVWGVSVPVDEVYKLVSTPRGFQLPRVR